MNKGRGYLFRTKWEKARENQLSGGDHVQLLNNEERISET